MSILQQINQEITRIDRAKADIAVAIGHKGVEVPADALLGEYPALVEQIEQASPAVLQSLMVTPSTTPQQIVPVAPVDGFNEVNVPAVTAAIDANIIPANIKKDVPILGVTGTFEGGSALVYSLNNYVLDGTQSKAIDTGLKLLNATDFPNGFLLCASLNLGSNYANTMRYFRCRTASSPYKGFQVYMSSATALQLQWDSQQAVSSNQLTGIVYVLIVRSAALCQWNIKALTKQAASVNDADSSLLIGGEKDADGEWIAGRFGVGTIESLRIYKL